MVCLFVDVEAERTVYRFLDGELSRYRPAHLLVLGTTCTIKFRSGFSSSPCIELAGVIRGYVTALTIFITV